MASQKPEVVKEFPVCPWCGSTETGSEMALTHLGLREKGLVKNDAFVSATKHISQEGMVATDLARPLALMFGLVQDGLLISRVNLHGVGIEICGQVIPDKYGQLYSSGCKTTNLRSLWLCHP